MTSRPLLLRATARALAACLAALVVLGFSRLQAEDLFYLPNLDADLFNGKKVDFGKRGDFDRVGTIKALVRIASDFDEEDDVENELRSNALGVAGLIDPENGSFKKTYAQLKESAKAYGDEGTNKSQLIGNIYSGVRALLKDKDNEDNKKCAAYCVDVALRLDPKSRYSSKLEDLLDDFKADDVKLDWKKLKGEAVVPNEWTPFPTPGRMEPRSEEMPGGKADSFATKQSSIFGLVVVTLSGGKHAGAASEIIATALKESSVDGVKFKIDQKVGDMMGNSLDNIVKYMRVKYEDTGSVPDGYEVSIVFEDRDTLTDGPSAGTAMSLMVDTLFSGSKVDPKFACTGGITPSGNVTKIGGVAAKIRGATRRNCNIVGVPEGNAGGVNDIVVLDGIQQILDIQVFTMKNFDQAFEISRAEKDAKVASVLSDFNKVAEVIRDKGEEVLKNSEVQKKLQGVIDSMPNHVSAKLLLEYAKGKAPDQLSVGGSFHEIDSRASGLFSRAQGMVRGKNYDHSDAIVEEAKEALEELNQIEGHVHEKFNDYLKSAIRICEMVEEGRDGEDEDDFLKSLKKKWDALQNQRKKLSSDPELREEIMG